MSAVKKFEAVTIVVTGDQFTISAVREDRTVREIHHVLPDGTLDCTDGNFEDDGDLWKSGLVEPLIGLYQGDSSIIDIMKQLNNQ